MGRTAEPEGVAIVSGGGGGGGGPDCAAGADRRDDGPVTGTGPELRGGRKVSSSRQVTARRNRLHKSTIFCSVLWCWAGVISCYWPILDEASDSIARMTSYCTEKVVTSYSTSFFYCKINQRNVPLWRSSGLELRGTSPTPLRPRSEPLVERARHVCASSAGTTVGSPRTPRRCAADPRKRRRRGQRPKSRRKDGPCRPTASLVPDPAVSTYNRKF